MDRITWWREWSEDIAARPEAERPGLGAVPPIPSHLVELLDDVETRFQALRTAPGWPDPHAQPGAGAPGSQPAEAEYGHTSDPARYRLLHERGMAWADTLLARGLATATLTDARWRHDTDPLQQGRSLRLASRAAGALDLFLRERQVDLDQSDASAPLPILEIGIAHHVDAELDVDGSVDVEQIARLPECGCDACDDGSESYLQVIDERLLAVVDGSVDVTIQGDGYRLAGAEGGEGTRTPSGSSVPRSLHGPPWHPEWPTRAPLSD